MKIKKSLFVTICLIILLVPNIALAAETFTYGDYTYSIEKVNIKTDLLTADETFIEIDEQGNYIFENYDENKYYKVNEKECILMSDEEVLKFKNTASYKDIHVSGYDVLESQRLYFTDWGYIKTSDTEIDPNKQYWEANTVNASGFIEGFGSVLNPNISEIDTYYEEVYFRYPETTEIDKSETYYTKDEITGTYVKVDSPISADINKYRIKYNTVETKIATLNAVEFEKILENYYIWSIHIDEATNELYVSVTNGHDMAIYTSEGTLVRKFKDIEPSGFSWYSNSFFGIKNEQGTFQIMDKEANIIFESETLPLLFEIKNENNVMYLNGFNDDGRYEFYNMYENKIVNDDNDSNTDIDNSNNNGDANNAENGNTDVRIPNAGEKDDTPKTGNNDVQARENILFVELLLISIVGAFATIKFRKNVK